MFEELKRQEAHHQRVAREILAIAGSHLEPRHVLDAISDILARERQAVREEIQAELRECWGFDRGRPLTEQVGESLRALAEQVREEEK